MLPYPMFRRSISFVRSSSVLQRWARWLLTAWLVAGPAVSAPANGLMQGKQHYLDFEPIGIFFALNHPRFDKLPIEEWERTIIELKRLGFNCAALNATPEMLEVAARRQFKIITHVEGRTPEWIERMERYPSLLAWYGIDEPERSERLDEAIEQYEQLGAKLGRPMAVSLYLPSAYPRANEVADVVMPDPYIFGHTRKDGTTYPLTEISRRIEELRGYLNPEKRIWAVPQLYAWYPYFRRPPTPAELEVQTIMCLAEGADGIIYYSLNSGSWFPDGVDHGPAHEAHVPSPWNLMDHPELVEKMQRMNRFTSHVLRRFEGPAIKTQIEDNVIEYRWVNGEDSLTARLRLGAEPEVEYDF